MKPKKQFKTTALVRSVTKVRPKAVFDEPKQYNYTTAQFNKVKDLAEHFNEGDTINVYNKMTDKTETYIVETKKVFTKTSKDWALRF